jgi:murein DD-endopeptidase MepM/ murein hydrolase activator NlpD
MNKKDIKYVLLALIISSGIFLVGYTKKSTPVELYHVYLNGDTIGYIEDKALFEKYIDDDQTEIKEKYNVDKVFLPKDLDIVKETTYNKEVSTEEQIYERIKDKTNFTISGYTITIKGYETQSEEQEEPILLPDKTIYVIDREIFEKALKTTVESFVKEEDYENFINKTQPEIDTVGSIIEDIYIKNTITISEGRIPADAKIFTDEEELSRYMLFGTTEEQKKYVVQSGENISTIANNNKLSPQEFLIANPNFTSENNLLYEGQVVNVGIINPAFTLIEEDHTVEYQTEYYKTETYEDDSLLQGYERVDQEGEDGILLVTKKVQKQNGEISQAVITRTEVVKPAVTRKVAIGSAKSYTRAYVGSGVWAWPTTSNYCITSYFQWRTLNGSTSHHDAVDISCSGEGSPIYAANNGIVEAAEYKYPNGNYVVINHQNGYYTIYAHMSSLYVSEGETVSIGEIIGTMGHTGYAFGTHLHFGMSVGYPYRGDYYFVNPLDAYK